MDHEEDIWDFKRHSLLLKDGTWNHWYNGMDRDLDNYWKDEWVEKRFQETHPYFYFNYHKGDQSCLATIHVEEREWTHKFNGETMIHTDVEISFDKELGSQAGSWKGGIVGTHYTMLPNETPLETLRRMERERQFR